MTEMRQFINVLNEAVGGSWIGDFNTKYGPMVVKAMRNAQSQSMGGLAYWYIDTSPLTHAIDDVNDPRHILEILSDVITCCNLKHLGLIIKGTVDWEQRVNHIRLYESDDRHAEQDVLEAALGWLKRSIEKRGITENIGSKRYYVTDEAIEHCLKSKGYKKPITDYTIKYVRDWFWETNKRIRSDEELSSAMDKFIKQMNS